MRAGRQVRGERGHGRQEDARDEDGREKRPEQVAERDLDHGRRVVAAGRARHDDVGADGRRQARRYDKTDEQGRLDGRVAGALDRGGEAEEDGRDDEERRDLDDEVQAPVDGVLEKLLERQRQAAQEEDDGYAAVRDRDLGADVAARLADGREEVGEQDDEAHREDEPLVEQEAQRPAGRMSARGRRRRGPGRRAGTAVSSQGGSECGRKGSETHSAAASRQNVLTERSELPSAVDATADWSWVGGGMAGGRQVEEVGGTGRRVERRQYLGTSRDQPGGRGDAPVLLAGSPERREGRSAARASLSRPGRAACAD